MNCRESSLISTSKLLAGLAATLTEIAPGGRAIRELETLSVFRKLHVTLFETQFSEAGRISDGSRLYVQQPRLASTRQCQERSL